MNYQELQSTLKTYQTYYGHTLQVKLNAKKEALQAEYDRIVAAEAAKHKSLKTDEVLTEASAEFDEVEGLPSLADIARETAWEADAEDFREALIDETQKQPDEDHDEAKTNRILTEDSVMAALRSLSHKHYDWIPYYGALRGAFIPFSDKAIEDVLNRLGDKKLVYFCQGTKDIEILLTEVYSTKHLIEERFCRGLQAEYIKDYDPTQKEAGDCHCYVRCWVSCDVCNYQKSDIPRLAYHWEPTQTDECQKQAEQDNQEVAFVPEVSVYELAQQCSLSLTGDAYSHTLNWLSSGDFFKTFYGADALRDVRDFLWKRLYRQQRAAEAAKCQVLDIVDYSKPFRNIEVVDLSVVENRHGVYQDYNCYFCKARATKLVNRVSNMSDKSYSDPVCSVCAKQWEPATKAKPEEAPVTHPEFTCTTDQDFAAASIQFGERLYCHVEPRYNVTYGAKSELTCDVDDAPLKGQACHVAFGQSSFGWHFCNRRLTPVPDKTPAHAYEGQVVYPDHEDTHFGCYVQLTCDICNGQKSDLPDPQDTVDNLLAGVSTESVEAIKKAMQAPVHYQQVRKLNLLDRATRCLDCAVAFCDGFLAGLKAPAHC